MVVDQATPREGAGKEEGKQGIGNEHRRREDRVPGQPARQKRLAALVAEDDDGGGQHLQAGGHVGGIEKQPAEVMQLANHFRGPLVNAMR